MCFSYFILLLGNIVSTIKGMSRAQIVVSLRDFGIYHTTRMKKDELRFRLLNYIFSKTYEAVFEEVARANAGNNTWINYLLTPVLHSVPKNGLISYFRVLVVSP